MERALALLQYIKVGRLVMRSELSALGHSRNC